MARTNLTTLAATGAARPQNRALAERQNVEALIAEDTEQRENYATSGLPPDWLNTGLAGAGAGWIFGPVGGLIGAAVTSILSKRRREGIATQAAADSETAQSLIAGGDTTLRRLESAAETDQDRLEVELLRDQYEQAVTVASNPDPRVAAQGFQALLSIPGLASAEADEIEAANLERETRVREKLETEVTQLGSLADDYRTESRPFTTMREDYANLVSAFDEPNGAGDIRGVYTFLKMLDPESTIMPGELALAENTGGIANKFRASYNKLLSGESLTPNERIQFTNEGREAFENARQSQNEINTRFMERGRASGIRPALMSTLTVDSDPLDAASYRTPDPLGRQLVDQVPTGARGVDADGTVLSDTIDYWSQFGADQLSGLTDSTYSYDQQADQWYQTDKDGQTYAIPAAPPGMKANPLDRPPPIDPADTDASGDVGFLEALRDPARQAQRQRDALDRELLSPGLFQIGGTFGRDLTPDEQRRRDELLERRRSVNE